MANHTYLRKENKTLGKEEMKRKGNFIMDVMDTTIEYHSHYYESNALAKLFKNQRVCRVWDWKRNPWIGGIFCACMGGVWSIV